MIFNRQSHSASKAFGFGLLGLAAGAATTYYLYATKDGARRRAKIGKFAKKLKEGVSDAADDIREDIKETIDKVKA